MDEPRHHSRPRHLWYRGELTARPAVSQGGRASRRPNGWHAKKAICPSRFRSHLRHFVGSCGRKSDHGSKLLAPQTNAGISGAYRTDWIWIGRISQRALTRGVMRVPGTGLPAMFHREPVSAPHRVSARFRPPRRVPDRHLARRLRPRAGRGCPHIAPPTI